MNQNTDHRMEYLVYKNDRSPVAVVEFHKTHFRLKVKTLFDNEERERDFNGPLDPVALQNEIAYLVEYGYL